MVSVQKDEKCAAGRWHQKKSAVSENIVPEFAGAILSPHWIHLSIVASIQDAQIKIAACIIDTPVPRIGMENRMDNQIRKSEEEGGHSTRVGNKLVSFK